MGRFDFMGSSLTVTHPASSERINGVSWPALQKRSRPDGRSRIPMKNVMNMFRSLLLHSSWLMACTMLAGLLVWAEVMRNSFCMTAITMADGTPFPETSPMQKNNFSSRM